VRIGQEPMTRYPKGIESERRIWVAIVLLGLILSGIGPYDRVTWWMEVFPVLIGLPLFILTRRRFPMTPLAYRLIAVHALILMWGGHHTYARVPLGFWIQDLFHLTRNHYDRLGHFAQGFIPAILAREVLLRRSPLYPGKMLFFLVTSICLAISASYEFIEWWAAIAGGEAADAFLGTQGDVWDTQWDMFLALIGSITAQLTLARMHDRELEQIKG
jgi:putative membrane protein